VSKNTNPVLARVGYVTQCYCVT